MKALTASLHTVTAVARVAVLLNKTASEDRRNNPEVLASMALDVLGYFHSQYANTPKGQTLFAACVAATAKAIR